MSLYYTVLNRRYAGTEVTNQVTLRQQQGQRVDWNYIDFGQAHAGRLGGELHQVGS